MKYSNNVSFFYSIKETIKLAWKTSWYWLLSIVILLILHSAMISYQLILQNRVIDSVSDLTEEKIQQVIILIIFYFIIRNLTNVIMTIRYLTTVWFGPMFDKILRLRILDKYQKLDMINYEDAELHNVIERANNSCYMATNAVMGIFQTLSGHVTGVIGVLIFLIYVKPELSLLVVFAAIPEIVNYIFIGRKNYQHEKLVTPIKRRMNYFEATITSKEYFKETRLLGAYSFLKNRWFETLKTFNKKQWELSLKIFPMELISSLFNFLGYSSAITLATYYLYTSQISLGEFASTLTALTVLKGKINAIIINLVNIYNRGMASRYMYNFLNLKEREGKSGEVHPINNINIKDITFKYNSSLQNVIDGVNLKINKGDIIAIVGNNGAGKSSLIKIVTGLLKASSGKVLYNNIDIKNIDEDSAFKGTSVLFQSFGKYQFTLRENVGISKHLNMNDDLKIMECLNNAGFKVDKETMRNSLDTLLGTEFGGVELSGGEWQQIALARAYFKDSNFIILDEPTSAIDPIRENNLYEKFKDICKGKTAIVITHRMSAAKIADKVIVLNKGKISEFGTHEELMELNQSYARMYKEQASWYLR